MNVEKAAYWLVLAAFGFAIHGVCPRGALRNLNHALCHTGSTLCRLTTNAERSLMASSILGQSRLRSNDSLSAPDALQLAQDQRELAREQAEQVREQALTKADVVREDALAKAEAMREQALAQAALARADVELRRAEIQQLRVRIRPLVQFSHAADRRILPMSGDPCGNSLTPDLVSGAIELSDDEQ